MLSKKYPILILFAVFALILSACGDTDTAPTPSPLEELQSYVIVRPEFSSDAEIEAAIRLRKAIESSLGVTLKMVTDWVDRGEEPPIGTKEILIGATNRPESSDDTELRRDDYLIKYENGRLALIAGSDSALLAAIEHYLADYVSDTLYYPSKPEHYKADYAYASVRLGGILLEDYTVTADEEFSEVADRLTKQIYDGTGIVKPSGENLIRLTRDSSLSGFEAEIRTSDGEVVLAYSEYVFNAAELADRFISMINARTEDELTINERIVCTAMEPIEMPTPPDIMPIKQDNEVCDYYVIGENGTAVLKDGYGCTSYLDCFGASTLTLTTAQSSDGSEYGIAFYGEDYGLIDFIPSSSGEEKTVTETVGIPSGACYFRASYFGYEKRQLHGEFEYTLKDGDGKDIELSGKRPYQSEFIYFSREVNQSLDPNDTENIKATTGVLALPENYTADGEKTPLIVYFHGYSHYVYFGKWGSTDSFVKQKQNFLNAGFAVLDCNGARDNNRQPHFTSAGSPQFVDAYWQCVQYALEHYNLSDEIYVIGGSAGGALSMNFCETHKENVKALILLSAWFDLKTCEWDQNVRGSYVEYLGFSGTDKYEADKAEMYDPLLRLKKANSEGLLFLDGIEVIYCYGGNEALLWQQKWPEFFSAIGRQKPNFEVKVFENREHSEVVSGADPEVDKYITDYFWRIASGK